MNCTVVRTWGFLQGHELEATWLILFAPLKRPQNYRSEVTIEFAIINSQMPLTNG